MRKLLTLLTAFVSIFSLALSVFLPVAAQAQTVPSTFCYTFSSNLGVGRPLSSADANALEQVLVAQGFWTSNNPITAYTEAVASAVVGFQQKYAAEILTPNGLSYGTGYVGASTRAELNILYACSNSTTTSTAGPFQCPSGWSCTPPTSSAQTYSCPSGWVCTPIISVTTPISPPVTQSCPIGYACTTPGQTTTPVVNNSTAGNVTDVFTKIFSLASKPSSATLSLAADNTYQVTLNGQQIANNQSEVNFMNPATFDVTSALQVGSNTLTVTVVNLASTNTWSGNPGGLIYKITDSLGNVLAVSDGSESVTSPYVTNGTATVITPTPGVIGRWTSISGAQWIWDPRDPSLEAYLSSTQSSCSFPYVCSTPVVPINPSTPVNVNATPNISSISPSSGYAGSNATQITIYGSGFSQGDTVSLFIAAPAENVDMNTATVVSVSSTQITASIPALNSGMYSVQVGSGGTESNTVPYMVNLQNLPPASFSTASVSWDSQAGNTYYNPRLLASGFTAGLKPANDAASAIEWCQSVPGQGYTSGTFSGNPYSNEDDYKYDYSGSQWTRMIQGEYASEFQCLGGPIGGLTN